MREGNINTPKQCFKSSRRKLPLYSGNYGNYGNFGIYGNYGNYWGRGNHFSRGVSFTKWLYDLFKLKVTEVTAKLPQSYRLRT